VFRRPVIAAVCLGLALLVPAAAPASAAGSCGVTVPSRIALTSPYKEVKVQFSAGCEVNRAWAWWDVVHPSQGLVNILDYDFETATSRTSYLDIYDWDPLGTWNVRPQGGYDGNDDPVVQNTTKTVVKVHSKVALSGSRSGNYVTLTAKPTAYSPNYNTYRAWPGATVKFYYRTSATGTWKLGATRTSSSSGVATARLYASTVRDFRVVTTETSGRWGQTSSVVRR
jgi:hypothetical protein